MKFMKRKAVIFGCGHLGMKIYSIIKDDFDVMAFSDNNSDIWGNHIDGLIVVPPGNIKSLPGFDGIVIICVHNHYHEIARQPELAGLNVAVYMQGHVLTYDIEKGVQIADFYKDIEVKPKTLTLELTSICNLRCRYCPWHGIDNPIYKMKKGHMSWDVCKAVANQAKEIPSIDRLSLTGKGELFMHPEWFEMVSHVLKNVSSVKDVKLYQNGMLLTPKNVYKLTQLKCEHLTLVISIDGFSPQDSEYWRIGSSYQTIKTNVENACKHLDKSQVRIFIRSAIVLPKVFLEETSFSEIEKYMTSCGDFLREDFPDIPVITVGVSSPLFDVEGTKIMKNQDYYFPYFCTNMFDSLAVSHTGNVLPCSCHIVPRILGNVLHDDMHEVWAADNQLNKIRADFRIGIPACTECPSNPWNKRQFLVRNA